MLEKIKDIIKNKNPFRRDKITDNQIVEKQINKENSMEYQGKKTENNESKEENMSEYQGSKSSLNYTKVQQALNKAKGKKNNSDSNSLKDNLTNLSKEFNALSDDDKQEELKSEKFIQLAEDIKKLKNNQLKKIIDSMENQKELSEYENLSKQIEVLTNKLDTIEKENLKIQGSNIDDIGYSTENIAKIINESFWDKLKNSIQIPKLDLSSITQKIESINRDLKKNKSDIDNSSQALSKKIDNIKFPSFPTPQKIPNDYLKKEDFEFTINDKLKDLQEIKESSENLETVPAKVNSIEKELKSLSEKMDNLPSSNGSQTPKHIPKEEKSIIDLAKYMTDGVTQFENIAKEYISKIGELEKLDKIKEEHQKELEKVREEALNKGKESGKIEFIKNLAESFPTEFKTVQSTFEDLLEEKFEKDEILEINDSNKNEMLPFIQNKIENGKYKVVSPAILIDNTTLFKAHVEKPEEEIKSVDKADESITPELEKVD